MHLGIGSIHVGKKGGVKKVKKTRGVICHAIFNALVIKNRRVNKEMPQMERTEVKKVRSHRFIVKAFFMIKERVGALSEPE